MGGQQGRLQPHLLCFVDYIWKKTNVTAQKHRLSLFAGRNFTTLYVGAYPLKQRPCFFLYTLSEIDSHGKETGCEHGTRGNGFYQG